MTSKFSQPVVCPVLVGREDALEGLVRVASGALSRGQVALISGEAGIGKTRLLTEFLDDGRAAGYRTWQGRFFEQDGESPYSGIRRLIVDVATGGGEATELLTPMASGLRAIAPSVFAEVTVTGSGTSEEDAVPESEERRVLEALGRLVRELSSRSPVVLSFEDVHWADTSSLAAILEIARDETPGCLIVLTFRSDERSAALDATLAALDRERLASEIRLGRLGLAEVDRMLGAILSSGQGTRADVLHLINRLSDGNPFFVEEVTRSLLDRAGGMVGLDGLRMSDLEVPRGITEAVQRRTQGLSPGTKETLSLAAVAGVRFDFPLLCELSGRSEDEVLLQIKELIAAQLVVEEAEDTFAFRHALTREAIRSQLLQRERRALSRRVAFAMQARYGDQDHVEDLAWQFYEAGEWGPALRYCREAGERALALYAPVEARGHLTRAIDAGERIDPASLAEVCRLRGSANEAIGDFEAAREDYERAAELADKQGERRVRWQALLDLGLLWASRDYGRSEPYYSAALSLAREMGDPSAVGHSLNRLGNLYSNQGDFNSAQAMSEEALATFRGTGDELGVAQTLDLLGMTCLQGMQFKQSVAYYREAIDLLVRLGDKRTLASALSSIQVCASTYQTSMLPPGISLAAGSVYGERGLGLSRQLGWRAAEAYASWQLAFCLGPQGEYAKALQNARDAERISREIGHIQWEVGALCALGATLIDILAVEEAEECLQRAEVLCRDMRSSPWAGQVAALLVDAQLARHKNPGTELVGDPSAGMETSGFGARVLLVSRGDLALANGDLELASAILRRLEPEATDADGGVALRVARLRAGLLGARGDLEGAAMALRDAERAARKHGNASYGWRLNADLAAVLLEAGDREGARAAAHDAISGVESLARAIPEQGLAENFVARAGMWLPGVLRGRTERSRAGVLTGRETEAARLIARGMTSREIADELVLSVRTVESHVANAMAKLGFTTRAQLAAWAAEQGLLDAGR